MSFEKVVEARIFGVTAQDTDTRMPVGDSAANAHTRFPNPMRGTLLWDECTYVLQGVAVAGGATGGSYTVTIQTDAITGYTGLPIASVALGPNSPSRVVMTNSHNASCSPIPTHMFIDQTAAGGEITLQCHVLAKQYRGTRPSAAAGTAERIIVGTMLRGTNQGGFADSRGMTEDATFTLGTTGSALGMHRMRLWGKALYWVQAGVSIAGTHDVDIVGRIGGATFSIASTGTAGAVNVAGEKVAIASNCAGLSPNPTQIIWTETTAGGVSDARVIVLAKTGRGSMAKA